MIAPPPPLRKKNYPRLGLGLGSGSRLELVLGLVDNQKIAPDENCAPVRVRV